MEFESLDKLVELRRLWNYGIKEEQLQDLDIVILPENFDSPDGDFYDAQDAITVSKLLKSKGIKCANSFDLGLEIPTKERRSNDVWLGVVYVFNTVVMPIVTGVVGSVLATLITDWKKRKDLREPAGIVHVEITIIRPAGKINFKYDGEPEALVKILKTLENHQIEGENS